MLPFALAASRRGGGRVPSVPSQIDSARARADIRINLGEGRGGTEGKER